MTPQELAQSGRPGLISARRTLLDRFDKTSDAADKQEISDAVDAINDLITAADLDDLLAAAGAVGAPTRVGAAEPVNQSGACSPSTPAGRHVGGSSAAMGGSGTVGGPLGASDHVRGPPSSPDPGLSTSLPPCGPATDSAVQAILSAAYPRSPTLRGRPLASAMD